MMAGASFSTWYLLMVSAYIGVSISSEVAPGPPTKLEYECPNMNCTVRWRPPTEMTDKDVIRYSVKYQICHELADQGLMDIPECTDVTDRECNLGAHLADPNKYWCVFVQASDEKYATTSMSEMPAIIHPSNDATIDKPEIEQVKTTNDSIFVSWRAPKTPYYNSDGTALRVDDFQVVKCSLNWITVDFRYKNHYGVTGKRQIYLNDRILPGTTYVIELRGRINSVYGTPTLITVKTEEESPLQTQESQDHLE